MSAQQKMTMQIKTKRRQSALSLLLATAALLLAGCGDSPKSVDPSNPTTQSNPAMSAHQKAVRASRTATQ